MPGLSTFCAVLGVQWVIPSPWEGSSSSSYVASAVFLLTFWICSMLLMLYGKEQKEFVFSSSVFLAAEKVRRDCNIEGFYLSSLWFCMQKQNTRMGVSLQFLLQTLLRWPWMSFISAARQPFAQVCSSVKSRRKVGEGVRQKRHPRMVICIGPWRHQQEYDLLFLYLPIILGIARSWEGTSQGELFYSFCVSHAHLPRHLLLDTIRGRILC